MEQDHSDSRRSGCNAEKKEIAIARQSFEGLKQVNEHGAEYWSARALQPMLGYSQWRRFEQAIERAVTSCKESGNPPENHFAGSGKMVDLGSGSVRKIDDYQLSRFAFYLIAQNGDPRKPENAKAQQYFAIQTRRQERSDQLSADKERLELRKQTSEEFKALSGAALSGAFEYCASFPKLRSECASPRTKHLTTNERYTSRKVR
jgi:DNA-damage-inducible protein D